MNAVKRKVLILAAVFAGCVIATVCLLFLGRGTAEDNTTQLYYFTNYASSADLIAASIENETGEVVLAQTGGQYYATTGAVSGSNDQAVASLFEAASHVSLSRAIEGASSADAQYGLASPRAEITLQDVSGGGLIFRLGSAAPNGEGVYACLSGDERVFLMDAAQAALYLANIYDFLDLAVYPALDGSAIHSLREITVSRAQQTAYRLSVAAANEEGTTVYLSLDAPWHMLLGAGQAKDAILTPLRQLKGVSVSDLSPAESGLTETADTLRLAWQDGTETTVLVGSRADDLTPVMAAGGEHVLLVPTATLSFMDAEAADIAGGNLLNLNINDISALTIGARRYDVFAKSGSVSVTKDGAAYDETDFQNTIFTALNKLSIGGAYTQEQVPATELLHIKIETTIADETIELGFYQLDGRRCAVSVNGTMAVWCDLIAISALLPAAS